MHASTLERRTKGGGLDFLQYFLPIKFGSSMRFARERSRPITFSSGSPGFWVSH